MARLELKTPKKISEGGFTLVELLIVIFIVGLMSSVVVMTLPVSATTAQQQANNLINALSHLSREAIASGRAISWTHISGENLFETYAHGEWITFNSDSKFISQSLTTKALDISVDLLGAETLQRHVEEKRFKPEPTLIFFPTGEVTPADIRVSSEGLNYHYELSQDGEIIPKNVVEDF